MIFRIVEDYNDEEINKTKIIENNDNICFICYENKNLINLKTQQFYYKICTCNGLIHKICLDKWYDNKQECPICRETMKVYNFSNQYRNKLKLFIFSIIFSIVFSIVFSIIVTVVIFIGLQLLSYF